MKSSRKAALAAGVVRILTAIGAVLAYRPFPGDPSSITGRPR